MIKMKTILDIRSYNDKKISEKWVHNTIQPDTRVKGTDCNRWVVAHELCRVDYVRSGRGSPSTSCPNLLGAPPRGFVILVGKKWDLLLSQIPTVVEERVKWQSEGTQYGFFRHRTEFGFTVGSVRSNEDPRSIKRDTPPQKEIYMSSIRTTSIGHWFLQLVKPSQTVTLG